MERFFNSNKFINGEDVNPFIGMDTFPFLKKQNIIPATNFLALIIEKLIIIN